SRHQLPRLPDDSAGAGALAAVPAVQHRSDRKGDGRNVHGSRRHQQGRSGLVAADGEHNAIERVTVKNFDETKIGEVAVETRRRALAGLLDRMNRKLEGDAAGLADAFADALGQDYVMAIA